MDVQAKLKMLEEENKNLHNEITAKSDFLSIIVHQLRTPLSATKWIFKMMMDGDLGKITDEQRSIIQRGFASNEQSIHMLAEVSEANHVSEWKLHYTIAPTRIDDCLQSLIGEFAAEAKAKSITLSYSGATSLPPVLADHEKICLVFQNLIENAIKYNKEGGRVVIKTEIYKNSLVVSVSDTGIGIPLDNQKSIFKKFFRADNSKSEKGTGLGLFVCKEIVDGHHGTIWFESAENVGSTFFVSLPLA